MPNQAPCHESNEIECKKEQINDYLCFSVIKKGIDSI